MTNALLLALAACSTKHVSFSGEAKLRPTAEENYQAGEELLRSVGRQRTSRAAIAGSSD